MKINRFLAQTRSQEKCKYQVNIPLNYTKDVKPSEKDKYYIEIFHNGKPFEVKKKNDSYTLDRTDELGIYKFSVQLKKENRVVEEQQIEVRIEEEINIEIDTTVSPPVEIDDSSFFEKVEGIINNIDLKVGRRSVQWGMGSFPTAEDKDSEAIFKQLKAFNKDDEIVQIICKIISDKNKDGLLIWKSVTTLKFFRSIAGINYIKDLAIRSFSDKNITQYMHSECIKNLDAVNSLNNRKLVETHLKYFALECVTPQARSAAAASLIKNGKRNDETLIQFLFKITKEDTNSNTKLTALDGLSNYNISNHQEKIEELLQDASPEIRKNTSAVLIKNPLKLDFDFLTEIFEQETDKASRKSLCDLLYKNYLDKAISYFLSVIDMEDEDYTNTVLDTINYGKDVKPLVGKFASMKDTSPYSAQLSKKIEDFLRRHQKSPQG